MYFASSYEFHADELLESINFYFKMYSYNHNHITRSCFTDFSLAIVQLSNIQNFCIENYKLYCSWNLNDRVKVDHGLLCLHG